MGINCAVEDSASPFLRAKRRLSEKSCIREQTKRLYILISSIAIHPNIVS